MEPLYVLSWRYLEGGHWKVLIPQRVVLLAGSKKGGIGVMEREKEELTGSEYCWQESRRCKMAGCWSRRCRGACRPPSLLAMVLNTSSSTACGMCVCMHTHTHKTLK